LVYIVPIIKHQLVRRIQTIYRAQYVCEDFALSDKTKKNAAHTRCYIGKMVDNVFVPNKRCLLEREPEAAKEKKPGAVCSTLSTCEFCGATNVFDQIESVQTRIRELSLTVAEHI